jgi:alkanesulfonate monooxygenase SsuD/methylene tetrahydromethanopterin reductase-like flavin-dependent oxidoreductase (luciferase family)
MSPKERWDRLMEKLEEMKRLWAGEKRGFAGGVGPDVSDNPPKVFLGGRTDPVFKRAARVADGSMMGRRPARDVRARAREARGGVQRRP